MRVFLLRIAILLIGASIAASWGHQASANPMKDKCRKIYNDYLRQGSFRAFATRSDKRACGWAAGYRTQKEADARALAECRKHGKCYIMTNTGSEVAAKKKENAAKDIQTALNALGFNVGKVDGDIGPGTRGAIKKFQNSINHSATGFLTTSETTRLFEEVALARAKKIKHPVHATYFDKTGTGEWVQINAGRDTVLGLGKGDRMAIWDARSGALIYAGDGAVTAAGLSGDGRYAIYAARSETSSVQVIERLDLADGSRTEIGRFEPTGKIAVNGDGTLLAMSNASGLLVQIAAPSGKVLNWSPLSGEIRKVLFDPKGGVVLALVEGVGIEAIDVATGGKRAGYLPEPFAGANDFALGQTGDAMVVGMQDGRVVAMDREGDGFGRMREARMPEPLVAVDLHEGRKVILAYAGRSVSFLDLGDMAGIPDQTFGLGATRNRFVGFAGPEGRIVTVLTGSRLALRAINGVDLERFKSQAWQLGIAAKKRRDKAMQQVVARQKKVAQAERAAAAMFEAGDCDGFAATAPQYWGTKTIEACEAQKEAAQAMRLLNAALAAHDCAAAQYMADKVGGHEAEVKACFAEVERQRDLDAFALAMADGDCEALRVLQDKVGRPGSFEACQFSAAMTAPSARQMFLAAAKYDAADQRTKARAIYGELMNRFPEDDLALQAALRLTAINDLETTAEARAKSEAEMRRLKQQAEAATRAAERARNQAAQAAANRAATAQRAPGNACRGVYRGLRFNLSTKLPKNTKQALGFMLEGGLYGAPYYQVVGVSPETGLATIVSLDTGRSREVNCSAIR